MMKKTIYPFVGKKLEAFLAEQNEQSQIEIEEEN